MSKATKLLKEEMHFIEDCPDDCQYIDAHAHRAGLVQLLDILEKQPEPNCKVCDFNRKTIKQYRDNNKWSWDAEEVVEIIEHTIHEAKEKK